MVDYRNIVGYNNWMPIKDLLDLALSYIHERDLYSFLYILIYIVC